jgi:hypothetical protein
VHKQSAQVIVIQHSDHALHLTFANVNLDGQENIVMNLFVVQFDVITDIVIRAMFVIAILGGKV